MKTCIECGAYPAEIGDNLCKLCREEVEEIFKEPLKPKEPMFIIGLFKIIFAIVLNPLFIGAVSVTLSYLWFGWQLALIFTLWAWTIIVFCSYMIKGDHNKKSKS